MASGVGTPALCRKVGDLAANVPDWRVSDRSEPDCVKREDVAAHGGGRRLRLLTLLLNRSLHVPARLVERGDCLCDCSRSLRHQVLKGVLGPSAEAL